MPIITISLNNIEEEMAAIKAMLEKLVKESEEKEVRLKLQEEKIARLSRKLERRPARFLIKSSESEDKERISVESEASNEEVQSKKGGKLKNGRCPSSITVEQI